VVGSERHVRNATERIIAVQGQFRVIQVVDFGTNRKLVYDFILVINSNLGPVLHRLGDAAVYWSKNRQNRQFVPTPVSEIALALGVTPIECRDEPDISRNKNVRLSDGEEMLTLAIFVLIQYRSVTDGQTDGHSCSGYTSGLHSSLC